jgi:Spy/CpxP family protein refolding chaperone
MRRNLMFLPAAALATAMLATAVHAQSTDSTTTTTTTATAPVGGWHHHHHHGMLGHVLKQLNLTDTQKASVKTLFQQTHATLKPQIQAVRADREALIAATPGSAAYTAAANKLATDAATAATARVQAETGLVTQVYGQLTDEQKATFATLQQQHAAKMAAWQAQHPQAQ